MSQQQQRDNDLAERIARAILEWVYARIERRHRGEKEPAPDETQVIQVVQQELVTFRAESERLPDPNDT